MNTVLQQAGSALEELGLRYGVDPTHDQLFVLFNGPNSEDYALLLTANDDACEMFIVCSLTRVGPRQKTKVALFLTEQLNARFKYVTFSILENHVVVDIAVDLEVASDQSAAIAKGVLRLLAAIHGSRQALLRIAHPRGVARAPQAVRDAEAVLDELRFD